MDYKAVSQQVVDNVGGLENIEGATHCVTRLRLVLKDTSKYNKAELENIDGVKGVLYNSGQLMIIFGTGTVNKVYDEFMALTGVKEISASEVKGAEADKKGKFFSVLKVFGGADRKLDREAVRTGGSHVQQGEGRALPPGDGGRHGADRRREVRGGLGGRGQEVGDGAPPAQLHRGAL